MWQLCAFLLLFSFPAVPAQDAGSGNQTSSTDGTGPSTASTPACCDMLKPMLPFLKADSLEQLLMPVLIFSQNNNGTLKPTKNRVRGSMCICGAPNGTGEDWLKTKMGVRGSTSVKDFTRKSYGVTAKTQFLGEHCNRMTCIVSIITVWLLGQLSWYAVASWGAVGL
jgi:hypothetical protein